MPKYKEIHCWNCDRLELHKEIDEGVWKCQRCGNKSQKISVIGLDSRSNAGRK